MELEGHEVGRHPTRGNVHMYVYVQVYIHTYNIYINMYICSLNTAQNRIVIPVHWRYRRHGGREILALHRKCGIGIPMQNPSPPAFSLSRTAKAGDHARDA